MAAFELFDTKQNTVDVTKRKLTRAKDRGWYTAYGRTPVLCDGAHNGIYRWDIKILTQTNTIVVGIDEGRTNMKAEYNDSSTSTCHYALMHDRYFYEKGTYWTTFKLLSTRNDKYRKCNVEQVQSAKLFMGWSTKRGILSKSRSMLENWGCILRSTTVHSRTALKSRLRRRHIIWRCWFGPKMMQSLLRNIAAPEATRPKSRRYDRFTIASFDSL